jgi:hypothetical protein
MNTKKSFCKYLNNKTYKNGEIITNYVNDLISDNKYNNIMFIRTPTTGAWLDDILPNNNNIIRLCYYIQNIQTNNCKCHKLTSIINLNNLEQTIKQLNTNNKYDLIVIDPYHEYNVSYNNFNLLLSFLNDDGCIISHDCYPTKLKLSTPIFKMGDWCGQTYLAFIQFAYNNPHLFYAILNIDTGIGIINKRQSGYLRNNLDKNKQEHILSFDFINDYDKAYNYFINNSSYIINGISL